MKDIRKTREPISLKKIKINLMNKKLLFQNLQANTVIFNFSILFDFSGKIRKIKILRVESFKKSKKIKNQKGFNMEGAPLPL